MSGETLPTLILGAGGYVGGELLRLLAAHPKLKPVIPISRSHQGKTVSEVFPHLWTKEDAVRFETLEDGLARIPAGQKVAVFSALPHGEAAPLIAEVLARFAAHKSEVALVDLSADFRLESPAAFERVYGHAHGAPERYDEFYCGLPDLESQTKSCHLVQPGCFTTAVVLGAAPLAAAGLLAGPVCVAAVTGSTGSGQAAKPATHHPERHGNFLAYSPLRHRHRFEMERLLSRVAGTPVVVQFVPHSGPFARGIHATSHVALTRSLNDADLLQLMTEFYAQSPFVSVASEPPRLKEVVGSNRCRIFGATEGRAAVLFSVIDNLIKGAAGGGVQWMNRRLGFEETLGLNHLALGWN